MYQILGKQTFSNDSKGKTYYIIHYAFQRDGVEGLAVKERFVNSDIFGSVRVGKRYNFAFEEGFDGSARLVAVRELKD